MVYLIPFNKQYEDIYRTMPISQMKSVVSDLLNCEKEPMTMTDIGNIDPRIEMILRNRSITYKNMKAKYAINRREKNIEQSKRLIEEAAEKKAKLAIEKEKISLGIIEHDERNIEIDRICRKLLAYTRKDITSKDRLSKRVGLLVKKIEIEQNREMTETEILDLYNSERLACL